MELADKLLASGIEAVGRKQSHRFPEDGRSILAPHARAQRQRLLLSDNRPGKVPQLVVPAHRNFKCITIGET